MCLCALHSMYRFMCTLAHMQQVPIHTVSMIKRQRCQYENKNKFMKKGAETSDVCDATQKSVGAATTQNKKEIMHADEMNWKH